MNLITLVRGGADTLERVSALVSRMHGLRLIDSDHLTEVLAS